jgi:hypothetical protein
MFYVKVNPNRYREAKDLTNTMLHNLSDLFFVVISPLQLHEQDTLFVMVEYTLQILIKRNVLTDLQ